jgi:threonine dehydrogenase-like Zn-dependent dehydrogenase
MPTIREDGDAIIQLAAACVCGSDLWAYRGVDPIADRQRGAQVLRDRSGRRARDEDQAR